MFLAFQGQKGNDAEFPQYNVYKYFIQIILLKKMAKK